MPDSSEPHVSTTGTLAGAPLPSINAAPDAPRPRPGAVAPDEREPLPDIVRGIALCGILLANIVAFGRWHSEYFNPAAVGEPSTPDLVAWTFNVLLVDMKFMTLFSILFGAGFALMYHRATARRAQGFALVHYSRTLWLLVFGLLHAYLLFWGDILFFYAVCALLLYPMRRLSPKTLAIVGSLLMVVPVVIFGAIGGVVNVWERMEIQPILQAREAGQTLTNEQNLQLAQYEEMLADWSPPPAAIEAERSAWQGSLLDNIKQRAELSFFMQLFMIPLFAIWRNLGLMLLGMALLRWGVLTGSRDPRFYGKLAFWGYATGLPLCALAAYVGITSDFAMGTFYLLPMNLVYVGSIGVALGHFAMVALWWKARTAPDGTPRGWLMIAFSSLGRTAFSNYILQSVVCNLIFYGIGFSLFGEVARWQLPAVALGILAAQLVLATWWLKRFRMGPLEWVWRTLTYRSRGGRAAGA